MTISEQLKAEIEAAADKANLMPSTIGKMVGQGGRFYQRLCEGKRVWPETAESVRARLAHIVSPSAPSSEGSQPGDSLPDNKGLGGSAEKQGQVSITRQAAE